MKYTQKIVTIALLALNTYSTSLFSTKNDIFKNLYARCGLKDARILYLRGLWHDLQECDTISLKKSLNLAQLFLVDPTCEECLTHLQADYEKLILKYRTSTAKKLKQDIQKLILDHAKKSRNAHEQKKARRSKKTDLFLLGHRELHDECDKTLLQIEQEKSMIRREQEQSLELLLQKIDAMTISSDDSDFFQKTTPSSDDAWTRLEYLIRALDKPQPQIAFFESDELNDADHWPYHELSEAESLEIDYQAKEASDSGTNSHEEISPWKDEDEESFLHNPKSRGQRTRGKGY